MFQTKLRIALMSVGTFVSSETDNKIDDRICACYSFYLTNVLVPFRV
jgi:hypothetical protein